MGNIPPSHVEDEDIVCSCMKVQAGVITHRVHLANELDKRKGVICHIAKPENMPVDIAGNRADIVMDDGSIVNRMNLGVPYRLYFGSAYDKINSDIKAMLNINVNSIYKAEKAVRQLYQQNPALIMQAHEYLTNFYKLITDEQYQLYLNMSIEDIIENLSHGLVEGFTIYYPPDNPKETHKVVQDIQKYYPPVYGPITYVDNSGRRVTTKKNIRIGTTYMMLLDKIADNWASVASCKLQHFGVLSPITKAEKHTRPWHNSATRTVSETEGRLYAGYCGREAIAEIHDRSNSPLTHEQVVNTILSSPTPGNIDMAIDRSKVPLGAAKPLQLFDHFAMCAGFQVVYEPEHKKYK